MDTKPSWAGGQAGTVWVGGARATAIWNLPLSNTISQVPEPALTESHQFEETDTLQGTVADALCT